MIVDTGVLFAAANDQDPNCEASQALLLHAPVPISVPALVIAEVSYLVETNLGQLAAAKVVRSLASDRYTIYPPSKEDLERMAELMLLYNDLKLGATDASLVALAERLHDPVLATLDRRHFTVVSSHMGALTLLPETVNPSRR